MCACVVETVRAKSGEDYVCMLGDLGGKWERKCNDSCGVHGQMNRGDISSWVALWEFTGAPSMTGREGRKVQENPVFHSSCELELGIALQSLQG